jgi:hypothetical protein
MLLKSRETIETSCMGDKVGLKPLGSYPVNIAHVQRFYLARAPPAIVKEQSLSELFHWLGHLHPDAARADVRPFVTETLVDPTRLEKSFSSKIGCCIISY